MARIILAFNGDLEARLALHWLAHEQGHEVVTLSINLGQEEHLQTLGEIALELGAMAAQVIDCREMFLRDFALPLLHAGAVYQDHCYLGSALARYVIAQELVRAAHDEGYHTVAHCAASKGNDQVRMETAIAALNPELHVLAPVRQWPLRTQEDKLGYARRHRLPIQEVIRDGIAVDRNLWGVSLYLYGLTDAWSEPPASAFLLTRSPEQAPNEPTMLTLGFDAGIPVRLNSQTLDLVSLVRQLNRLGGENGIGRSDAIEDRLLGIKSREIYETPAPHLLFLAVRELESLVQSRELRQFKPLLSRRYAELAYMGLWFHDLRHALDGFFQKLQARVTGEVRLKLFKGNTTVLGRRSPYELFDSELAGQCSLHLFENDWAAGFTALWTLSSRLAARQRSAAQAEQKPL